MAAIADEALAHIDGRRLARVASILQQCTTMRISTVNRNSCGLHQQPQLLAVHRDGVQSGSVWKANVRCAKGGTFLKAKPRMAMRLPEMVLNIDSMTRSTKRCFW